MIRSSDRKSRFQILHFYLAMIRSYENYLAFTHAWLLMGNSLAGKIGLFNASANSLWESELTISRWGNLDVTEAYAVLLLKHSVDYEIFEEKLWYHIFHLLYLIINSYPINEPYFMFACNLFLSLEGYNTLIWNAFSMNICIHFALSVIS